MYELKIYREVMCYDNEEWCKIWQISTRVLENLKNLHFNGMLLTKVYMFELRKYRGVMFDGTQDWCKVWRKIELWFLKWHDELGKFHKLIKSDFILESKMTELN